MPCLVDILGRPALFGVEAEQGGSEGEGRWRMGETGGRERRGNCGLDVIYERIKIIFLKKSYVGNCIPPP